MKKQRPFGSGFLLIALLALGAPMVGCSSKQDVAVTASPESGDATAPSGEYVSTEPTAMADAGAYASDANLGAASSGNAR